VSAWSRALALAEHTPPSRNRYVDFLRGLSIERSAPLLSDFRPSTTRVCAAQAAMIVGPPFASARW